MSNLTLIWQNQSDDKALSGGSWQAALPLSNMQDKQLSKVARSSDATLPSSQFTIDLGGSGVFYQSIAVLSHNLSPDALIRVQCSDDAGFVSVEFDSGWQDAYTHSVPSTELLWEQDNWWTGKPQESDLSGYSRNTVVFTEYLIDARYIKIEIDDQANTAGAIDIGRLMIGPYTELITNISYGAKLGWEDRTLINETISGAEYSDARPKKRVFTCSARYMKDAEAFAGIFEMQKNQGMSGEIFVIPDRDDTQHFFRKAFLARMTQLSGIEQWAYNLNAINYQFRELL